MLPKFLKQEQKAKEKKLKEAHLRVNDIVNDIGKLLDEKGVNYYEMIDIMHRLQGVCNMKLTQVLISNSKKIKTQSGELIEKEKEIDELNTKINLYENASNESKESSGKETGQ